MKILMVCLGNICRSPIAHGLLEHKCRNLGYDWEIDSAGTSDWHEGEIPNAGSLEIMAQHGIDISHQHSRLLRYADLNYYDIIYVMDKSNYRDVVSKARSEEEVQKVKLILNELFPGKDYDVPDPYERGTERFQEVYRLLDEATDKIIERFCVKTKTFVRR